MRPDDQTSTLRPRRWWAFWIGLAAICVVIPGLFWLRFGRLDGMAFGLAGFLAILALAAEFVPRMGQRYGSEQAALKVKPGRLDFLGVVWLLSIPFGPLALWIIGSFWVLTPSNWQIVLGVKTFACIVVPSVCVLPLFRYVRGKAAPYSLLILFVGTGFPISVGWASAMDLAEGPTWKTAEVVDVSRYDFRYREHDVRTDTIDVKLRNGEALEVDMKTVPPQVGENDLLVLTHLGRILAARPRR